MLTQERLKEALNYDPESGLLTRKIRTSQNTRIGDVCGSHDHYGYIQLNLDGKIYKGHRISWFYIYGEWPDNIDHINGIKDDNRISNLRSVSLKTNSENLRSAKSNNKTGFLGVSIHHTGKYCASIKYNNKKNHLGLFSTPELAYEAYLSAKRKYHSGNTL